MFCENKDSKEYPSRLTRRITEIERLKEKNKELKNQNKNTETNEQENKTEENQN